MCRAAFPCFFFPRVTAPFFRPLSDVLVEMIPEEASIARENLRHLHARIRRDLADFRPLSAVAAGPLVEQAAKKLAAERRLPATHSQQFLATIDQFCSSLPEQTLLLGFGEHSELVLFLQTVRHQRLLAWRRFRKEVERLAARLSALLQVEKAKGGANRTSEALGAAVGTIGNRLLDSAALAKVLGKHRGSKRITTVRQARIEKTAQVLDDFLAEPPVHCHVFHEICLPQGIGSTSEQLHPVEDAIAAADRCFDRTASRWAQLFAAVRIAQLELAGNYRAMDHGSWFENFHWSAFGRDELALLPVIVALPCTPSSVEQTASLSRLLCSAKPVNVIVWVNPAANIGHGNGVGQLIDGHRFELAYFAMAQREAAVRQSAVVQPQHLASGFAQALQSSQSFLHVLADCHTLEMKQPELGRWLHVAAALEARAHPCFGYRADAGSSWAQRVDFSGNPQPGNDWSAADFEYLEAGEPKKQRLSFTFADYAFCEPAFRDHFRVVPESCAAAAMFIPLAEYLNASRVDRQQYLPFIWAIDDQGVMQRVVVSRAMAVACQDRLDYWRTLQAFAGVGGEGLNDAAAEHKEKLQEEVERQLAAQRQEQEQQLAKVRDQTASEALSRLASALAGVRLETIAAIAAPREQPLAQIPTEAKETAAPSMNEPAVETAPEREEQFEEFDQPWIESALCTSCNDCTNANPRMFAYNENKQAQIGDPRAGAFAELVKLAEACPAHCIYPGSPQNPDEPNLPALIERARPLNRRR